MIRLTTSNGRRAGFLAIGGICTGLWIWGLLSVMGVAAIIRASPTAFDTLRFAGAAYILWVGAHAVVSGIRCAPQDATAGPAAASPFLSGFATNVLNPKIGVFYVSVLPQFIPNDAPFAPSALLLVAIHTVEGAVWLGLLVLMVQGMRRLLGRPAVKSALEVVTGLSLIGLGVALALERR